MSSHQQDNRLSARFGRWAGSRGNDFAMMIAPWHSEIQELEADGE